MESYIGKGDVVEAKVFIEHSGCTYSDTALERQQKRTPQPLRR